MSKQQLFSVVALLLAGACQGSRSPKRPEPTGGDDTGTSSGAGSENETGSEETSAIDTSSTDPSDTAGSSDASGDPSMPCDGTCLVAPLGWVGPVVLASEPDQLPSCADATYADAVLEAYSGVVAPEADCDCSCSVSAEVSCEMTFQQHDDASCVDRPSVSVEVEEGCNDIPEFPEGYFAWTIDAVGGACEASLSMSVPDFDVADHVTVCRSTSEATGACDGDGSCWPSATDDAPLCWWKLGDVECPETLTGERQVIYNGVANDTRGCSECTCAAPDGSCDHPGLILSRSDYCYLLGEPAHVLELGGCEEVDGTLGSVDIDGEPTATTECDPAGQSTATGSVEPQGPITVCCGA